MSKEPTLRDLQGKVTKLRTSPVRQEKLEHQIFLTKEKLASFLSSTPAVFYTAKPSGSYGRIFASKNVKGLTGFSPVDFTKDSDFWFDHVHTEDKTLVLSEVPKIIAGDHHAFDYRFRCKDGHYLWVRDEMKLLRRRSGKPKEIVGYCVDITDQKTDEFELKKAYSDLKTEIVRRDEQLLTEVEARMAATEQAKMKENYCYTLLSNIHEDILVIDRNYQVTDMNGTCLRTTGLLREDVIGRHCFEVLHGLTTPCQENHQECKLLQVFYTGTPLLYRHEHLKNNGEKILVSILLSPLRDESGEVTAVIAAMRDLTELIEREKERGKTEAAYRSLFENSMDSLAVTSRDGDFINVNPAMLDLLGYTREEIMEIPVVETYADPQARPRFQAEIERKGYVKDYAMRLRRKDGTTAFATMTARVRHSEDGAILGYEGIMRDVTASRIIEEKLRKREKELKLKSKRLEESNATLQVLLKKVNKDTKVAEGQIVTNLQELVFPLLRQLQKSHLNEIQKSEITMLESNLHKVFEPFARNLLSDHAHLTPTEIQVAHLIKEGKSSKEAAQLLNISIRTVGCYRESIRKKLKVNNKKVNLRSYLLACNDKEA